MGLQELLALQAKRTGYSPDKSSHVEVRESGPKPKKELKKTAVKGGRSEKMRAIMKALGPLYKKYLYTRPDCAIVSPVCTGEATCVNHKAGRAIGKVMDEEFWEPSCEACNGWIENNDAWAREHGHKKSRLTK